MPSERPSPQEPTRVTVGVLEKENATIVKKAFISLEDDNIVTFESHTCTPSISTVTVLRAVQEYVHGKALGISRIYYKTDVVVPTGHIALILFFFQYYQAATVYH
jgi:hypothetical protein